KRLFVADQLDGAEKNLVHEERQIRESSHGATDIKVSVVLALQIIPLEYHERSVFGQSAQGSATKLHRAADLDLARDRLACPGRIVRILDDVHHDRRIGQQLRD